MNTENAKSRNSFFSTGIMDSDGESITRKGNQKSAELSSNHQLSHNQKYLFSYHILRTVLLFTTVTLTCLLSYQTSASPFQFFPQSNKSLSRSHANNSSSPYMPSQRNEELQLDQVLEMVAMSDKKRKQELQLNQVLEKAAMPDKTVIITTLNEAWIEPNSIFGFFLKSFRIGKQTKWLLKHLVVVALDKRAFDYCLGTRLNCYFLTTDGINFANEAHFMTPRYLKMMWRRIDFLRSVLEMGYNFVFTDADIMWLRNPFPHFYSDTDFQISCDSFGGDPYDLHNAPNGGFNYVKSSNQTIEFYKFWYESRKFYPRKHDQDVLNNIKYDHFVWEIGLEIKFLDTAYFGGFCQPSKDLNLVTTMHANCCAGLDNKIHDLKILLKDWRKYLALPDDVRKTHQPSWSVPQSCGARSFSHHTPRKKNRKTRKGE